MRENKLLMLIASAIIVATALFASSSAMAQTSGTCGDNATWTYDENTKTLTISGTGAMSDYTSDNQPWSSIQDIQTVIIGNGITTIGENAFYKCKNLTSVTILSSVKTIKRMAFFSCLNLISVTLSEGLETIGPNAFGFCMRLTSITIPKSVKKIDVSAFGGCLNLLLTVPETVETIGNNAFKYVNNIEYNGDFDGAPWGAYAINGYIDGDYIYSDQTKTELLRYIGNDTEVKIPDGVTTIGVEAFYYYTNDKSDYADAHNRISKVYIPNSVTTIGFRAFADNNIISVTIPENVTTIGEWAFDRIYRQLLPLQYIYFKNAPEKLQMSDVSGNDQSSIDIICYVSSKTIDIWEDKFGTLSNLLFTNEGEEFEQDGIDYVLGTDGSATVVGHTDDLPTEVVIPPTITKDNIVYPVTVIGSKAFKECEALTSVTIPNGVTTIGRNAFSNCKNLTSFNIPDSIKKIGTEAFYLCNNLEGDLILPEGVITIGEYAFYGCNKITALSIPESVISIGKDAFDYVKATDVWWHASLDKFASNILYSGVQQIHVPTETLDKFNEKYGNRYTFVGDVTNIAANGITIEPQTYTGSALTPVVKDGDKTLVEGEDYTITLPQGGCTNAGEYTVALQGKKFYYKKAEKTFTILPAPVTVTAENKTKTFGESDPTFTAKVTGLVNNESPDLITYTLSRTEGENAGEYTITPKGDEKQGNYVVSFVDATLTITKATPNPEPEPQPEPDPQNPSTPVSSIDNGGNNVKVWSYAHTIYIASTPDSQYKIIDLQGRTIKSATTKSSYEEVSINNSGIYVVIINGKSYKVSL